MQHDKEGSTGLEVPAAGRPGRRDIEELDLLPLDLAGWGQGPGRPCGEGDAKGLSEGRWVAGGFCHCRVHTLWFCARPPPVPEALTPTWSQEVTIYPAPIMCLALSWLLTHSRALGRVTGTPFQHREMRSLPQGLGTCHLASRSTFPPGAGVTKCHSSFDISQARNPVYTAVSSAAGAAGCFAFPPPVTRTWWVPARAARSVSGAPSHSLADQAFAVFLQVARISSPPCPLGLFPSAGVLRGRRCPRVRTRAVSARPCPGPARFPARGVPPGGGVAFPPVTGSSSSCHPPA